jgi:hypothetical protein
LVDRKRHVDWAGAVMSWHHASDRLQWLCVSTMKNQEHGCVSRIKRNEALGLEHRRTSKQLLVKRCRSSDVITIQGGLEQTPDRGRHGASSGISFTGGGAGRD